MSRFALTHEFERLLDRPIPERGQNVMVRCPWHADGTPSMSIDLERGLWICFSCGEKGSIFSLAERTNQFIDETAITLHAYNASENAYEEERPDFAEKAIALHERALRERPEALVRYLVQKGLAGAVVRHFKLGWDGQRISMPYFDDDRVVGIKYRYPDGSKTNEKGTKRYIYNVNDVRDKKVVFLCEGESDAQRLWCELSPVDGPTTLWQTCGVGAIPGVGNGQPSRSSWELFGIEMLWAEKVYICFDADEAGDSGAVTPLSIFGERAVRARPTAGKDIVLHFERGGTLGDLGIRLD